MKQVTLSIDGRRVRIDRATPLIEAARTIGIAIPTLCYHESLSPYGSCRLCAVEVIQKGRSRLVTSCNFPSEEGLEVITHSDRVHRHRRMVLELLLARSPDVPVLQEMARKMGIATSRFRVRKGDPCLLCGLCIRVCHEIVGANAIGFSNRGIEREVATPFHEPSRDCIGCGSCSYICPTGCIELIREGKNGSVLRMEGHSLPFCPKAHRCEDCEKDREFLERFREAIASFRRVSPPLPESEE